MAATLYTVAVWNEQLSGLLKPWHLVLFWAGLVFDTTGTTLMGQIAGGFKLNLHGFVGLAAIVLMLVHAMWATVALLLKKEDVLRDFHRFSVHVWALWMAALLSGTATLLVCRTGRGTSLGEISDSLVVKPPVTAFESGIHNFGLLILRLAVLMVLFVLLAAVAVSPVGSVGGIVSGGAAGVVAVARFE